MMLKKKYFDENHMFENSNCCKMQKMEKYAFHQSNFYHESFLLKNVYPESNGKIYFFLFYKQKKSHKIFFA